MSELRRSDSGRAESGRAEICTAAARVVQPEVSAAQEQAMICRQQAGFALKLISVLIFPTLIHHCSSVYWGKRMQNFTPVWNAQWKRVLVCSQKWLSFSRSFKFIVFLFVRAVINVGNKIIQSLQAMMLYPQFKWWSVGEKKSAIGFLFRLSVAPDTLITATFYFPEIPWGCNHFAAYTGIAYLRIMFLNQYSLILLK